MVDEVATLLHTGPHELRHPAHQAVQHLWRDAAHGRADVFYESGFWRRPVHLVDLVLNDRPEVFDERHVWVVTCCPAILPSPKRQGSCTGTNAGSWRWCELGLRPGQTFEAVGGPLSVCHLIADVDVPLSTSST